MAKNNRANEEKKENLEVVSNQAPEDRYQKDQQVAPSTGFNVNSGESNFTLQHQKAKGSTLKQDVAATVIKDASMGGTLSGDGASFGGMRSSGSVGGILGAANATPVAGKSRSDSRTSKKLDRNSTKLNFIPSDQTLVEWDESKPLADAAALDQGFNGTYRNEFARSQKNREAVPGALMFDRSVDLLVKDNIYFGQGQKVTQTGVTTDDDLKQTAYPNATTGVYQYPANGSTVNYSGGTTGNYLCESVDIELTESGLPTFMVYNEVDLACATSENVANKSSAQDHILMNDAELCRESMDAKAGDEKADIWTPLARAVNKPTQLVGFLRDVEAGVGNEVITSYRKACTSMSMQLNRAHKDGQDTTNPAILANLGLNKNYVSKAAAQAGLGTDVQDLFSRANYLKGEAPTMIALYDSTGKYNTKADFLVQPRGYRMHLQTADNNMDPLRISKLFDQVYNVQETFSTIDREYDPMAPICMTDKAAIVHRISWHKMGSFIYDHLKYTVVDKTTTAVAKKTLIPKNMLKEVKAAGYNVAFLYPHETNGDIDNYSNGEIAPDATFEWANGTNCELLITKDITNFSTSVAYKVGDKVVYGKELYACTTAHSAGSWNDSHFAVQKWDAVEIGAYCIDTADINTDYALLFNGNGSSAHKVAFKDVVIANDATKVYAYQGGPLVYMYADLRNKYIVTVAHPLTEGLLKYFTESIGSKYYSLITHNSAYNEPINIRCVHSTMYFSLWSFMLCAATPYIIKERINSFRDVLYYEKNVEYPFGSTLIPIREALNKAYTNFSYKDYDTELGVDRMTPATSIIWMLPELYQQVGYSSPDSQVLMPWYTNQVEVRRLSGGSYVYDDDASAMSFPSIRSGVRLGMLDTLYGMTEKDVRLSLDKISSFSALLPTLGSSHTYKYSSVGDGQLVLCIATTNMTALNIMSLPRELGFFMTAPYGVLTPKYDHSYDLNASVLGTTSFRCYYWYGANPVGTDDNGTEKILQANAINVNRAQNFTQDWYCVLASGTIPPVDHGFFLSTNHAFTTKGALLAGRTSFYPYASLADEVTGGYSTNMNKMRSFQKFLWTRIQKLPFILSPFEGLAIDNTDSPNNTIISDPYDFLYLFGLGGFRASDFRESVYNREKEVVNQGTLFINDPWVADSPIFKEGSHSTGIIVSKGFEL